MSAQTHEFACTGPIQAEVEIGAGVLLVTATDDLTATVVVSAADGRDGSRAAVEHTTVEFDRDRLTIQGPRMGGWSFLRGGSNLRVEVRLPTDSGVVGRLGSADLRTVGRLGTVEIKTGSGDISVAETSGDLRVQSGSGDVRGDVVGRELQVVTASGDVSASRVLGAATVKAASARIVIEESHGRVQLNTASGDIRLGAVRGPEVHVNSASGDVAVGIPTGTKVWLDLNTLSGSTSSDLEMTGQAPSDGPVATIQVRTLSGDIQIRKVS